jgi:mannose-6-phosphate isomerase
VEVLRGRIRDYAWGSRTAIAELQGRPAPSPGPEAEFWLGAHPGAPATVERAGAPVSLLDLVAAEPDGWLGADVAGRFGRRLPFLLKVLAAETPLSLQAHPDAEQARAGYDAEQARAGYAAEQAAGAAGPRNYVDPHHKPEMLVAASPFEALCGFRDPMRSAAVLAAFGVAALDPVVAMLRTGPGGLPDAVRTLLTWPESERGRLLDAVLASDVPVAFDSSAALARRLAERFPGDPGVLVALLLNHVILAPGEAIWMPAGNLHAYLHGTGVEILAASDNVLRGGLTPKHVDVAELIRVLRFEVLEDPVVPAVPVVDGVVTWPVPIEDFALHGVRLDDGGPVRLELAGPRLVLCWSGRVEVRDDRGAVTLDPGGAAIGAAGAGPLVVSGTGEAYVASVGTRR